jgi:hypothetical protein
MSSASPQTMVGQLSRISDADAARMVSPEAMADLAREITATPASAPPGRRYWRVQMRQPLLAVAAAATAVTAVLLVALGAFSAAGPTEPQAAEAAVLRGAAAALAHPPGSIVIESYTAVQRDNLALLTFAPGYKHPRGIQTVRWSQREITETPVGNGAQNEVNLGGPDVTGGVQVGEVNGNNELYDPRSNTVYIASAYGSNITRGPRPGTYRYRLPKTQGAPAASAAGELNAHLPAPLTITANQAHALLDGTAMVQVDGATPADTTADHYYLRIVPAFRVPSDTATIQAQLRAHKLKVDGITNVDGREAIKLISRTGSVGYEYDVAPGSYDPIRQVSRFRGTTITTTYSEYRVLPATTANQRLLNLAALHPGARVDRNPAGYRAAQARLLRGS